MFMYPYKAVKLCYSSHAWHKSFQKPMAPVVIEIGEPPINVTCTISKKNPMQSNNTDTTSERLDFISQ